MKNLNMKSHQNIMTDIQILFLFLAKNLLNSNSAQSYILYFDNLFINISLVNALRQLGIEVMRIMQVNAKEFFLSLIQLKHTKESLK